MNVENMINEYTVYKSNGVLPNKPNTLPVLRESFRDQIRVRLDWYLSHHMQSPDEWIDTEEDM